MTDILIAEEQTSFPNGVNAQNTTTVDNEDDEIEVTTAKTRRSLAQKLETDPDGKAFDKAAYRFYTSTGLAPDVFSDKIVNLMGRVKDNAYPVTARKEKEEKKTTIKVVERLAEVYKNNPQGLYEFLQLNEEEKLAILQGTTQPDTTEKA